MVKIGQQEEAYQPGMRFNTNGTSTPPHPPHSPEASCLTAVTSDYFIEVHQLSEHLSE